MKVISVILVFVVQILAVDFITETEYAKMLYQNPRGIGCDRCHGKFGEGKLIATYKDFNKKDGKYHTKELIAPPINSLSLQEFARGVHEAKDIMPTYFLTNDEIISLYKYVLSLKDESLKDSKKKEKNDK